MMQPDLTPGPDETLDRLSGEWWIFQPRHGHRYSTDDVLTAWTAWRAYPDARRILDLGAGVGSIGLMTLLRMSPEARLTTVEVQSIGVRLQRKTVIFNGLDDRVDIRQGDLRAGDLFEKEAQFDLVVANPPYLTRGTALQSPRPHRAAARMELHGDIRDFCLVAGRHLTSQGRFCFSFAASDPRPFAAVLEAGLSVLARQEVVFREGGRPVIALYTCGRQGTRIDLPVLTTRRADGRRTDDFRNVRVRMLIDV